MKTDNLIADRSKQFASRIVKLYKYLTEEKREFCLSKQVLRSGTSIGANIAESQGAQTKADFIYKVQIALKEANETLYWIDLLADNDYLTPRMHESLRQDCESLVRIMVRILTTAKINADRSS